MSDNIQSGLSPNHWISTGNSCKIGTSQIRALFVLAFAVAQRSSTRSAFNPPVKTSDAQALNSSDTKPPFLIIA